MARQVQWKVEGLYPYDHRRTKPFKINGWNWSLSVENKLWTTSIRLSLEPSQFPEDQPPFARFIIRVFDANCRSYNSPTYEKVFRTSDACTWSPEKLKCPLIIRVEFLDLKMSPPDGGVMSSILPDDDKLQHLATRSSSRSFSHMLNNSVNADITIATSDGKLRAHKAILSASSPVFCSMFTHDLKEKVSSTIEIEDMTSESCMALLRFLYGSVKHEEFWNHRLALLGAANKYDITDLKDACEESLLEDIKSDNVLDRLQEAWLYNLGKLKSGCFRYLLDLGEIHHVSREKMHDFLSKADRVLIMEMFDKMLVADIVPLGPDPSVTGTEMLKVLNTE